MSSISGIGSSAAQGLYSFVQSLSCNNPSASASSSSSPGTTGSVGGHHHRHHGGGSPMQQIQEAVTNALQGAQSNGATADPDKIIENAIVKVLQNGNAATKTPVASGSADPDGDGDGASGASGSAGGTGSVQSFNQLLQSFGVSPDQFRQDFLAAVKDAQNGQVNLGTAMQSFPLGSAVDTIG